MSLPFNDYHNYGISPSAWKHNIAQFFPSGSIFSPDDINDLRSRVTIAEREIFKLKQRTDIDKKTLEKLENMLPNFIVGTKDKHGDFVLPNSLWGAIHDKILSDETLVFDQSDAVRKSGEKAITSSKDIEKAFGKKWEKFVKENEVKAKALTSDFVDQRFHTLLESAFKSNILIRKSEVLERVQENWKENQAEIKVEMDTITRELNRVTRAVTKLEHSPASHTKAEIQTIAKDVFSKMLPHAQLRALASSNVKSNLNHGLTRLNHLSPGTGAVIEPHFTSPNFVFPGNEASLLKRTYRGLLQNPIPQPKPPVEALVKWEEHGDCWCSPTNDAQGLVTSLGVITGSNIFPEEVVVEHIISTAALEPGATPKEMELLAYIPEPDTFLAAKSASDELFPEDAEDDVDLPYRFVRVATWTYDINSPNNVQAFPVQLDLKAFSAHTNKIIIRSKNNWGGVDYTCLYRVRVHGEVFATPGLY